MSDFILMALSTSRSNYSSVFDLKAYDSAGNDISSSCVFSVEFQEYPVFSISGNTLYNGTEHSSGVYPVVLTAYDSTTGFFGRKLIFVTFTGTAEYVPQIIFQAQPSV